MGNMRGTLQIIYVRKTNVYSSSSSVCCFMYVVAFDQKVISYNNLKLLGTRSSDNGFFLEW